MVILPEFSPAKIKNRENLMLKAILFDMDGVIIDSEPLHALAAVNAMEKFGIAITIDFCYSFIGSTAKHMLEVIKEKWQLSATIEELMRANDEAKKELLQNEGYPAILGIHALMQALRHEGYKIAIASSSPREEILETVKRQQLTEFVQEIVSGMQVAHPKPAPDIFLAAAKALDVLPSECLVIEDSSNGLRAAKAAGISRLAFHNPNSGNQDLSIANCIVESFEEVTPYFLYYVYQHTNHLPAVITETPRLTLRELAMDDLPALYKILLEPSIARFCGESARSFSEFSELHKAYISGAYHFRGYGLWGVFLRSTGELIGRCGFEPTIIENSPNVELGYLISERFQRKGYASEAIGACFSLCSRFEISSVFAVIHPQNAVSLHLARKFGMEVIGQTVRGDISCNVFKRDIRHGYDLL